MKKALLKKLLLLGETVFGLILALVIVVSVFPFLPPFKNYYHSRTVLTGSMEPKIPKGSVVINQWADQRNLKIGDIITYQHPSDKKIIYVTHRIVEIDKTGLLWRFETKGDANPASDFGLITQAGTEGKVILTIPLIGYLIEFFKTPIGFILLIALPLLIFIVRQTRDVWQMWKKRNDLPTPKRKTHKTLAAILLAFSFLAARVSFVTYASFTSGQATITGVTLSTAASFDQTPPESSATDNQPNYQNTSNFNVDYTASDNDSGVKEVRLYYQYNFGGWQLFGTDTIIDNKFQFTSPAGDGLYEFLTIATDFAGNIEDDWDGDGILQDDEFPLLADTSTTVDTTSPVTMFSASDLMAVANEQIYNGGFENGNLDGWTVDSNGSDHQVTAADKKTGAYSALIGFKTAASSAEPAYDSIKQTVSLSSVITSTLSFWYRLLTESDVSGGFFDAFVTPTGSDPITVAHDGWDDPLLFDKDLDWKNVTYQLNGLEGKDIEIEFKVTQPYEGYKTWGYLDDVKVCAATNSAVTTTNFSLASHDGSGSNNSTINYSTDDTDPINYSGPFSIAAAGTHTISYSSTDEAGNVETEKQIDITIQTTPVDFGIVLNEFLPNPSGDDSAAAPGGEWVKLYNNSATNIDVAGWELKNAGGGNLTISGVVPAGGTLTVYRNGDSDFILNDQTETIKLYHGLTLVDSYIYNFATGLSEGKSLRRDLDGTGGWKDPEVGAEFTPESTPAPILIPIPEITTGSASSSALIIAPEPSPEAIPEPTIESTPAPILDPIPQITLESFPEPTPEPTPEPSLEPSPVPDLPTPEPIVIQEVLNATAE